MESLEKLKVMPQYSVNNIRQRSMDHLTDEVYMDHAAAALYSTEQINAVTKELRENLMGNPHSRNKPSDTSTQIVHSARQRILKHFNTTDEEYSVIFTSGATAAIKLVADNFDWKSSGEPSIKSSQFIYTKENHTSVVGVRGSALKKGVRVRSIAAGEVDEELESGGPRVVKRKTLSNSLFAFSAQCNYSGAKYPLQWINKVHKGAFNKENEGDGSSWFVLLDAASFVSTSHFDLTKWKPDFVPVSFYKIFGYPTGLGCLLVNRRAWSVLDKTYFGGGTVEVSDCHSNHTVFRKTLSDRFEDGTLSFLSIAALRHGFYSLQRLCGNMSAISQHVFQLSLYLQRSLKSYRHSNGREVVRIYSPYEHWTHSNQGGIVNFNILNEVGEFVGYTHVEHVATLYNICLRSGCMCNPGACQIHLGITSEILKHQHQSGHVCGDSLDIIDGRPTGSVRVSFGYSSTFQDADILLKMIRESFVSGPLILETTWIKEIEEIPTDSISSEASVKKISAKHSKISVEDHPVNYKESESINSTSDRFYVQNEHLPELTVTNIMLYPVKSCAALEVSSWEYGTSGLLYDRTWMIINTAGYVLTQKRQPKLSLIVPSIDLQRKTLTLSHEDHGSITIAIDEEEKRDDSSTLGLPCTAKICGDRVNATDCGDAVASWLNEVLETENIRLMKQSGERKEKNGSQESGSSLSLANDSQILLLHRPSVRLLEQEIRNNARDSLEYSEDDLVERFRANIILDGGKIFEEDSWKILEGKEFNIEVSGPCQRCQMVSVVPHTGQRTLEPLLSLNKIRGSNATFGVHAKASGTRVVGRTISKGDVFKVQRWVERS